MASLEARLDQIRNLPLHRYIGLEGLTAAEGRSQMQVSIGGEGTLNPAGMLHGGVVYTLCDVAAYAATLSLIDGNQEAVTHDLHISMLRAGTAGMQLEITARVTKRGRQLAFIQVEAKTGDKVLATASITKSILDGR